MSKLGLNIMQIFLLMGFMGGLSGCGQTGPLYLPENCPAEQAVPQDKIQDKYGKF